MVRLGASLVAATTGAAAAALAFLGGALAACVIPGDLEVEGIDCQRFDPTTTTTITTYYEGELCSYWGQRRDSRIEWGGKGRLQCPVPPKPNALTPLILAHALLGPSSQMSS